MRYMAPVIILLLPEELSQEISTFIAHQLDRVYATYARHQKADCKCTYISSA